MRFSEFDKPVNKRSKVDELTPLARPKTKKPMPANNPNATVGTQGTQQKTTQKPNTNMMRPGQKIQMPTGQTGLPADFKITKAMGNEVEIENPNPKPGEPRRFVFSKDELDQMMKGI